MWVLVISAVAGFAAGWLANWQRRRHRFRVAEETWQDTVDSLQTQLALEHLRFQTHAGEHQAQNGERAPILDLHREPHLARPHGRTSDSPPADSPPARA